MESEIEVEVADDHPIFNTHFKLFKYIDGQIIKDSDIELSSMKDKKSKALNKACSETILGKFPHYVNGAIYYFSNDMEAQANFEKADRAFEKGRFTEVGWTCYDEYENVCRLVFTAETFESLYINHLLHIQKNIARFRDILMPDLNNAQTIEEVESIIW